MKSFYSTFMILLMAACNQNNKPKTLISQTAVKEVFEDGKVKMEYFYPDSANKNSYIEIDFYESGNIAAEKRKLGSSYHGPYKVYWDSPFKTLYYEALNDHGAKIKYERKYDSLGRIVKYDSLLRPCTDSTFGCDAISTTYYPNGNTNYKYQRINGLKNGFYYSYYENGKLSFEATYRNGLENGILKWYDESGKYRQSVTAVNGKREGKADILYEDGVHGFGQYHDDKEDGLWIMKGSTGQIIDTVIYRQGKQIN